MIRFYYPETVVNCVNFKHAFRGKLTLFTYLLKVNEVYTVHLWRGMGGMRRIYVAAGAAAVTIAAAVALFTGGGNAAGPAAPATAAIPVRVAVAAPSGMANQIRGTGTLTYKREIPLAFKVQGILASFDVDSGDRVKKGQVLARIDPTEVQSRGSDADAQLALAETQLARVRQLKEKGFASQARVDDAQAAVERARAASSAASFDERKAVIVAPADGIVLSRLAEPNQVVAPGSPVMLLGDESSGMVVKVPLADDAVARIRTEDKASIIFSGLKPVNATVSRIAAKADMRTGAYDVELKVAETEQPLRSGMVGQARISPRDQVEQTGEVAVPALALLEGRGDQAAVFIVDEKGQARRVSVRIAGFADDQVLIAEGLKPGMKVVTSGAPYLRNGQPVAIESGVTGS